MNIEVIYDDWSEEDREDKKLHLNTGLFSFNVLEKVISLSSTILNNVEHSRNLRNLWINDLKKIGGIPEMNELNSHKAPEIPCVKRLREFIPPLMKNIGERKPKIFMKRPDLGKVEKIINSSDNLEEFYQLKKKNNVTGINYECSLISLEKNLSVNKKKKKKHLKKDSSVISSPPPPPPPPYGTQIEVKFQDSQSTGMTSTAAIWKKARVSHHIKSATDIICGIKVRFPDGQEMSLSWPDRENIRPMSGFRPQEHVHSYYSKICQVENSGLFYSSECEVDVPVPLGFLCEGEGGMSTDSSASQSDDEEEEDLFADLDDILEGQFEQQPKIVPSPQPQEVKASDPLLSAFSAPSAAPLGVSSTPLCSGEDSKGHEDLYEAERYFDRLQKRFKVSVVCRPDSDPGEQQQQSEVPLSPLCDRQVVVTGKCVKLRRPCQQTSWSWQLDLKDAYVKAGTNATTGGDLLLTDCSVVLRSELHRREDLTAAAGLWLPATDYPSDSSEATET